MVAAVAKAGQALSTLRRQLRQATQRSDKFLRWLRAAIRDQLRGNPRRVPPQGSLCEIIKHFPQHQSPWLWMPRWNGLKTVGDAGPDKE
jgi:hypothetical protein